MSTIKKNIWTMPPHVYKATSSGVDIFDYDTGGFINRIPVPMGVESVWAEDDYIYFAATYSGVFVSTVSGLSTYPYKQYPNITSNEVKYLHGAGDYLCVTTASGVDRYKISTDERTYSLVNRVDKCFQTSNGDYYYVINPFADPQWLDRNILMWDKCIEITLSHATTIDCQYELTLPDIYDSTRQDGDDIRFIDEEGRSLSYYISSWDYENSPVVWVKILAGTEKIYLIYKNQQYVDSLSDPLTVFDIYDDFNESTLSDQWEFYSENNYSSNTYNISNGRIRLICMSNSYTVGLRSTETFEGGVLEYSTKLYSPSYSTDLDGMFGFSGGVQARRGTDDSSDEISHALVIGGTYTLYGSEIIGTSYGTGTIIESEGYQASEYNGELLAVSGTLPNPGLRQVGFYFTNASNQPDLDIDWIRLRRYDPDPPTFSYSSEKTLAQALGSTKLVAVYESGGGHTYLSAKDAIIEAGNIHDIFITEGTSQYNYGNVIFLATSWGAYVIEERRGDEDNCRKKIYLIES